MPVKEVSPQLTKPQGNVRANMISIKDTLEKDKASNQQVRQEDLPRERFHLDHVKMYWKQFAYQVKEDGMETFYNALIKRDPVLKSEEILELTVDNLVQQNYIQTHLLTFKEFMRKQLNNYYIDIELIQAAPDEEEVKFLMGKDKFAALARKNPNLHTLKNRFNLDIDY
jgi:DNA polymerase-3 subunit gamma/tau